MNFPTSLQLYVSKSTDTQIFSTRYPVTCNVYTGYHGTSEMKHGLSTCTVDSTLTKAADYLRKGAKNMLYLSFGKTRVTSCLLP